MKKSTPTFSCSSLSFTPNLISHHLVFLLLFFFQNTKAQTPFEDAQAYQVQLREIAVLAVAKNYGSSTASAEFFTEDGDEMLMYGYPTVQGGRVRQKIGMKRLQTNVTHRKFNGSKVKAVSPDGNRVLISDGIYDLEKQKLFKIQVRLYNQVAWLENDKIYTYDSNTKYGTRLPSQYHYIDLNDLQAKSMSLNEMKVILDRINNERPQHDNFYLNQTSRSGSIYVYSKNTPYVKTLVPFKNGYPIKWFKTSPSLKYMVVLRSSEYYKNSTELVLYELKPNIKELKTRFTINNPSQYFGDRLKKDLESKGAVGLWLDVYEAKINPLNDKKVGANKNTFKGNMKVVEVLNDGSWVLEIGYHVKEITAGLIATNFRRGNGNNALKDTNGAWITLKE